MPKYKKRYYKSKGKGILEPKNGNYGLHDRSDENHEQKVPPMRGSPAENDLVHLF